MFPSLVPRSALPNAVALNSLLWKGSALVGPSLGGVAISLMGTAGAFYANAASFSVVVVTLLRLHVKARPESQRRRHFLAEAQEGFSYIVSRPIILGISLLEAVASIFGLDHTMLTVFASDILRVGAHGFGLLQSARGLGAVIGSSLYIAVRPTAAPRTYLARLGDFLRRRLRALRPVAVLRAIACIDDLCRHRRHDLGRDRAALSCK
jgi:hypothetical protein